MPNAITTTPNNLVPVSSGLSSMPKESSSNSKKDAPVDAWSPTSISASQNTFFVCC